MTLKDSRQQNAERRLRHARWEQPSGNRIALAIAILAITLSIIALINFTC